MEKSDLRLVRYFTEHNQGFTPDDNSGKESNSVEEHYGRFHCWVNEERKSAQSRNFREETVALVENVETGRMLHVDYDLLKFEN